MIEWKCFELHTHTIHSDGNFSLAELCIAAKNFLYDGIALTDHNTMSALDEIGGNAAVIPVIPGIEWTTYYGHLLVIGAEKYIDWRYAKPDTIDEYTKAVKEGGGVIGIAHPFHMGSPMCTGCYWDFKVREWNHIDYIEVWSSLFPQKRYYNELAFSWWTKLLNCGYHLAACAGRDWHRQEQDKPMLVAATWLGLKDGNISTASVKEALAAGRTIVSIGPFPELSLSQRGRIFYPGDTLEKTETKLSITVDENRRKGIWGLFGIRTEKICLVHNGRSLRSFSYGSSSLEEILELSTGWLRLEAYGVLDGEENKLLFFSSPWYIN